MIARSFYHLPSNYKMDVRQIGAALRHYGPLKCLKNGKSIHSHLIKVGHTQDVYVANNLISMYIDVSNLNSARKMFEEMPQRNNFTWTRVISAYTNTGDPHEAIRLYTQLVDSKTEAMPNRITYSVALKACSLVGDVGLGRTIHDSVLREGLESDVVLVNTLLDMYVKCGSLGEARQVFDGMVFGGNSTSWNTMISGYCKEGLMKEAVDLFYRMPVLTAVSWNTVIAGFADKGSFCGLEFVSRMHLGGFEFDEFTFPCALKICSHIGFLDMGKEIHCYAEKSGYRYNYYTVSALVDMYSNCKELDAAIKIFDQYLGHECSVSDSLALWNSMLSGYVVSEQNKEAINILSRIHHSGACIDSYTFSSALKVCINLLSLRLGVQVHGLVVTSGCGLDFIIGSVLIDLYSELGNIKDAFALFHRLPKKDNVVWSSLVMGCAKVGLNKQSFSLFRDMINLNLEVDQFVISAVLKACSSFASLGSGRLVHALCVKCGFETEDVTVTALINLYSKCGQIEDALTLFDCVPERDVVCWTGIIVGCGQNGRSKEALKLFQEMIQSGSKPNEVTFLGVLMACRHAGLVDNAQTLFGSMQFDHGIKPHVEHYYCMIDLLGQAGCFTDAEKLIDAMPFKPDKTILSSMLEACVSHRNTELVSMIAKNLLADFPDDPSVYVLLSNAYAALGMWDGLSEVRDASKKVGIIKEAGMSWVDS